MALDGPQEPDLSGGEQPVHGRGGETLPTHPCCGSTISGHISENRCFTFASTLTFKGTHSKQHRELEVHLETR